MSPTTIETFQKKHGNFKNMTAAVDLTVYETALRCAELNGYETVSSFVKDAVLDKIKATASAMSSIAEARYSLRWLCWHLKTVVNHYKSSKTFVVC